MRVVRRPLSFQPKVRVSVKGVVNLSPHLVRWREIFNGGGRHMPKSVWLLIVGMVINTVGSSFLWPLNTIYMHNHLGQSLTVAGLVLMANSAAAIVGNLLGGFLFDRIGGHKTILIGTFLTLIGLLGLTFWHGWPYYVWFLTFIGFSGGMIFPCMFAMVGAAWPEGGRRGFNAIYLAQNLGVAFGPALAGIVANLSFDYIFAANFLMYVVFFVVAMSYKKIPQGRGMAPTNVVSEGKRIKDKSSLYALCILGIGFLLGWAVYSQWTTTISTYTQEIGISLTQYSYLWTINGLLIVCGQPLIAPIVRKVGDRYQILMVTGVIIFMVSFFVLSFAETFTMFVVAMVILTFGEIFVWPTVPTVVSAFSPPGRDGFYQGLINSFCTTGRMVGPLMGGLLADHFGMHFTFYMLIAILAVSIIPYLLYHIPLKKQKI